MPHVYRQFFNRHETEDTQLNPRKWKYSLCPALLSSSKFYQILKTRDVGMTRAPGFNIIGIYALLSLLRPLRTQSTSWGRLCDALFYAVRIATLVKITSIEDNGLSIAWNNSPMCLPLVLRRIPWCPTIFYVKLHIKNDWSLTHRCGFSSYVARPPLLNISSKIDSRHHGQRWCLCYFPAE